MVLSYRNAGIGGAGSASAAELRALQHDLRSLGYLRRGIDGVLGDGTRKAVRALQFDLLHNHGASTRNDGRAPVSVSAYNRGTATVTGIVDAALADSIEAMLLDAAFPKVPRSATPAQANRTVLATLAATRSATAPIPFLLAIFQQESRSQHYVVPTGADSDDFVILGVDHNDKSNPLAVTSRGYGIGQYTLFHHPPSERELNDFVLTPANNVEKAEHDLADKFAHFVAGSGPGLRALDRDREHRLLPLRICRYGVRDARRLSDCTTCAAEVSKRTIKPNTPIYAGATETYGQAQYYPPATLSGVPDRAEFQCDWPYAARRYNGDGPDSYQYQARVLKNLLSVPTSSPGG